MNLYKQTTKWLWVMGQNPGTPKELVMKKGCSSPPRRKIAHIHVAFLAEKGVYGYT
jgi:hypothetical protein